MFLNSLFNASSAPLDCLSDHSDKCIRYSEIGLNQGARQSWTCSMEYSSFVYLYKRHYDGADYDGRKQKISYVGFSCQFFIVFFLPNLPHSIV